jgi:hypothetical protein
VEGTSKTYQDWHEEKLAKAGAVLPSFKAPTDTSYLADALDWDKGR